jgi:release factor glutamine methyltransferase
MIEKTCPSPNTSAGARLHSVKTHLIWATNRLQPLSESPRLNAEMLLAQVLGCSRTTLFAYPDRALSDLQRIHFERLVNRRAAGEPLPYITGHIEFYGLDFAVDRRVLIPRPETETLVDMALSWLRGRPTDRHKPDADCTILSDPVVVDVGTGSGCIAVTMAAHAPHATIYAVDVSTDALAVARENAKHHDVATQINFLESDLLTELPESVDLIVSNPPYIADADWKTLSPQVRDYEPGLALSGGPGGLCVVRRLLQEAASALRPGGSIFLEIAPSQSQRAVNLACGYFPHSVISVHKDLAGSDRVLCISTDHCRTSHAGRGISDEEG